MKNAKLGIGSVVMAMCLGATGAVAETTVRMWSFLDPSKDTPRERALAQIITGFERKHSDIKIKVEPQIWHQLADKFTLAAGSGGAPDVAWINYPKLVVPINAGVVADLKPLFQNELSAGAQEDFITKAPLDAVTVGGKVLAAPMFMLSGVVMYRKDAFSKQGLSPADVKTWDGMLAASRQLTEKTNGQTSSWGMGIALSKDGASTNPLLVGLLELQPKVFDEKCRPTVATEAGVKALQMQADFVMKSATSPEAMARTSDDNQDLFTAGRQAIVVGGSSRVSSTREKAAWDASQLGILKWPSWTGAISGPYVMDGWFAVVWNKSPNAKAAAAFVEYMMSREVAPLWTLVGGQVPFRKSVIAMPEMKSDANAWMTQVTEGWSENVAFLPSECNAGALNSDLNEATQKVITGRATPLEALKEVERLGAERL
ncbi:ABC transporter substrate-binding protein [Microvirga antarctica]|uniref:ABC transporter substrate-binding protein n=1 Tax=Microvirga antarctica TaxID=2819233 RepID=UPI001B30538C|nr:sugar ABC transporter substrate-binding protein [Microvirga antarctica]